MLEDKDALTCDFAEYYHILDWRALPLSLLKTLAAGLRADSRSQMRIAGRKDYGAQAILEFMADNLSLFRYSFTEDAEHGRNRPFLFADGGASAEQAKPTAKKGDTYSSLEDFRAAWDKQ